MRGGSLRLVFSVLISVTWVHAPQLSNLVGTWVGKVQGFEVEMVFALNADGTADLKGSPGTWAVLGDQIFAASDRSRRVLRSPPVNGAPRRGFCRVVRGSHESTYNLIAVDQGRTNGDPCRQKFRENHKSGEEHNTPCEMGSGHRNDEDSFNHGELSFVDGLQCRGCHQLCPVDQPLVGPSAATEIRRRNEWRASSLHSCPPISIVQ